MNIKENDGYILIVSLIAMMIISMMFLNIVNDADTHQKLLEEMITYASH